jgi:hypothetical protein
MTLAGSSLFGVGTRAPWGPSKVALTRQPMTESPQGTPPGLISWGAVPKGAMAREAAGHP